MSATVTARKPKPKTKNESFLLGSLKDSYLNLKEKPQLYLDVYNVVQNVEPESIHFYQVSPETLVVLQVLYSYSDFEKTFGQWIDVHTLLVQPKSSQVKVDLELKATAENSKLFDTLVHLPLEDEETKEEDGVILNVKSCDRPSIIVAEHGTIISGLPSVLRFLLKLGSIKGKGAHPEFESILGFRGGCLQACAESSIWTKFCEVDMIKRMLKHLKEMGIGKYSERPMLPLDLLRLEYHLNQPVKIHNFRKQINKPKSGQAKNGNGNEESELLNEKEQIPHDYAEGPSMTLADLILFPCVQMAQIYLGLEVFQTYLPNTLNWMHRMSEREHEKIKLDLLAPRINLSYRLTQSADSDPEGKTWAAQDLEIPLVLKESLYQSDSLRYNPKLRLFTRQADIEEALKVLCDAGVEFINPDDPDLSCTERDQSQEFDWSSIPPCAKPGAEGGNLPEIRREKKCQQLANLVQMVKFLVSKIQEREGSEVQKLIRIVDFCSGGGHLGILIAHLLPATTVLLVENKEESLRRGRERVQTLGLTNVSYAQCNLTSFRGEFEIGVGLHACGSATDLILTKCATVGASFVVCPCCYGSIQMNEDSLSYPCSGAFRLGAPGLTLEKYLVLAHSADQTHEEGHEKTSQGRIAMRAVDTDRLKAFEEMGYRIWLRRIIPATASPKNHILVGLSP